MFKFHVCTSCERLHVPDSARATTCLPCWKRERDYTLNKGDHAHDRLGEEARKMRDEWSSLKGEVAALRLEVLLLKTKQPAPQPTFSSGSFTQKQIRQLLMLCHPDKHNNSEASTEITKVLISLRKK